MIHEAAKTVSEQIATVDDLMKRGTIYCRGPTHLDEQGKYPRHSIQDMSNF